MQETRGTILIVVNVDWFFLSHRLPIALAAKERGYHVTVAARDTGRADEIRRHGLEFVDVPFSRSGRRVDRELTALVALVRLYRKLRPDLIHHVSIKPVLYGSLAARTVPRSRVVNAVSGMGYLLESDAERGVGRRGILAAYRLLFRRRHLATILQNPDHVAFFERERIARPDQIRLIQGSGVDTSRFVPPAQEPHAPLVMLPARMLRDKGVMEFIDAAELLADEHPDARFVLVGPAGDANPTAIGHTELEERIERSVVEWWGATTEMPAMLARASIVALPTYHEGLPKVLLEAASCARPIVATDIPGCRPVVKHRETGLLVPPRDAGALAEAVGWMLHHPEEARRMGSAGRRHVETSFSVERVVEETMHLYERMLAA